MKKKYDYYDREDLEGNGVSDGLCPNCGQGVRKLYSGIRFCENPYCDFKEKYKGMPLNVAKTAIIRDKSKQKKSVGDVFVVKKESPMEQKIRGYRGKRKSDGKWIYGHLGYKYEGLDGFYVIGENVEDVARVIPETIGQFTGLHDKNGTKIYERDIVLEEDYSRGAYLFGKQPREKIVVEHTIYGVIGFKSGYNIKTLNNIEVIGNIHENP